MDFYCKHEYYDKPEYESPDFEDIKYWKCKKCGRVGYK